MVKRQNKSMIFWEEIFNMFVNREDNPLIKGKDTIIHVWGSGKDGREVIMQRALDSGYGVILSDGWYLDKQNPHPTTYLFVDTWKYYYANEPTEGLNLTTSNDHLLLGGEVCQWGEEADETSIEVLIWPRAAAAAERLWSQKNVNDTESAMARLRYQRCRMSTRGIRSMPIRPDYCPFQDDRNAVFPSWIIAAELTIFSIITVIMITISIVLCKIQNKYSPVNTIQ